MQDRLEKLIKLIFRNYKAARLAVPQTHPDEQEMASFLEGRLTGAEDKRIKEHLLGCGHCAEAFVLQAGLKYKEEKKVPQELIDKVKNLVAGHEAIAPLEILLRLKEKFLELIQTNGDVVVGQELVPAPVLRSRSIKDFKDEINILKDFGDIRVEIKIESKPGGVFNLVVVAKEKQTLKLMKDLRVTLMRDDVELESYLSDAGKVVFEHVALGKYTIELSALKGKLASVLLDIKIKAGLFCL